MRAGSTRVLLVEDEASDALMVQRSLCRGGAGADEWYQVQRAESLAQAFDHLGRHAVDVLLLDLNLPDSSGPETVARLRGQRREVPLVAFTGDRDPGLSARSLRAGADEYLAKDDLNPDLLRRTIRQAIERRLLLREDATERKPEQTSLHELKNLQTTILGNARLLRDELAENGPSRLQGRAEALLRAARASTERIESLYCATSRSESFSRIELPTMVRRSEPFVRSALPDRVELRLELAGPSVTRGREDRLRSALVELVFNAADAVAGRGRIGIRTGCTRVDERRLPSTFAPRGLEPGPHAWFEVSDDGCGLDPDDLHHLMQRGISTKGAGRGHGLYEIQEILFEHAAALSVRSRGGDGSTFRVLLPSMSGH